MKPRVRGKNKKWDWAQISSEISPEKLKACSLNPNYNFETFIEGYSNKLSRSVAEAVAKNPAGTAFNPLFIHGASGVGKTHLANAIGTRIKELYPDKRVLYVSAHLFQIGRAHV